MTAEHITTDPGIIAESRYDDAEALEAARLALVVSEADALAAEPDPEPVPEPQQPEQ